MGLPELSIEFKTKAETAVSRSENGIVAIILADDTAVENVKQSYSYALEADITRSHWSETNLDYLNKVFLGSPRRVLVERIASADTYDDALARLKNKEWDWLAIPGLEAKSDEFTKILNWVVAQRAAKKGFKAVLPYVGSNVANNEGRRQLRYGRYRSRLKDLYDIRILREDRGTAGRIAVYPERDLSGTSGSYVHNGERYAGRGYRQRKADTDKRRRKDQDSARDKFFDHAIGR